MGSAKRLWYATSGPSGTPSCLKDQRILFQIAAVQTAVRTGSLIACPYGELILPVVQRRSGLTVTPGFPLMESKGSTYKRLRS